jgi:hypothetical protein
VTEAPPEVALADARNNPAAEVRVRPPAEAFETEMSQDRAAEAVSWVVSRLRWEHRLDHLRSAVPVDAERAMHSDRQREIEGSG